MPVQVSYPGVYVQEEPSGVQTITGVSTSIALFVRRTERGHPGPPTRSSSFQRLRSAASAPTRRESEMTHQVRQFFTNGGTQAYVMRIAAGARRRTVDLDNEAATSCWNDGGGGGHRVARTSGASRSTTTPPNPRRPSTCASSASSTTAAATFSAGSGSLLQPDHGRERRAFRPQRRDPGVAPRLADRRGRGPCSRGVDERPGWVLAANPDAEIAAISRG